jgi:hypothetical protein
MAGPFAQSAFSTGPNDDYRTVDVYKQDGKNVISSYTDRSTAPSTSGLGSLFGSNPLPSLNLDTKTALEVSKNALTYGKSIASGTDTKSMLDRAVGGLGMAGSALRNASPSLQKSLLGGIGDVQSIYAQVGNTVSRIKSGNLPDIRSVADIINKAAGAGATGIPLININDQNSTLGMAAGLIQQATRSGIPKSFSALTTNLISNPTQIAGLINKVLPSVTKSSDVFTLKEMALVQPSAIKLANPDILSDFSFNYKADDGTTQVAKMEAFGAVKETYSAIDPNWLSCPAREGGNVVDVSKISGASSDFKDMLQTGALNSTDIADKVFLMDTSPSKYLGSIGGSVANQGTPSVRDQLNTLFPAAAVGQTRASETPVLSPGQAGMKAEVEEYDVAAYKAGGGTSKIKRTTNPDGSYTIETSYIYQGSVNHITTEIFDSSGQRISKTERDLD